jgi:hypothetical protein
MAAPELRLEVTDRGMLVQSASGFAVTRGHCAVDTTRGISRPGVAARRLGIEHELHIRRLSGRAVEFWQSVQNLRPEPLKITGIVMIEGLLELEGAAWRVAHEELFKRDRFFGGYNAYTGGLFAPLPGTEGEFGLSEDLPFPGLFFTHPERGTVLMAVLSQERCKPLWRLAAQGRSSRLTAVDHFSGIPHLRLEEGRRLATERWTLLWTAGGIEDAVGEYYRLLRRRMSFPGADSILRRAVVWGSWNHNYRPRGHMDITHDYILANARALTELVPRRPRFVMIDDGYQRGSSSGGTQGWFASCMEFFHDRSLPAHDPALFPRGMKATAAAVRKAGALPAIWTTPRLHRASALAAERPDWLLQLNGGRDFIGRSAYLDYSVPEARAYTRAVWHTLLRDWGYHGIKLDFWSIPFEVPCVRFRGADRTAIEWRNLFLQDLRELIPADGYLLTGVVVNGGNPFIGLYADAARCAPDIGDGHWSLIRESATYQSVVPAFYRHDCLLADSDSIGWCPKNTPGENRIWATMALMTGGMCEIAGDLTAPSPEARAFLRTVTTRFAPARRTRCALDDGGLNNTPAPSLVLERDDATYVAHMNWMGYGRELLLPGRVRDLWTGRTHSGRVTVPPRDVLWFKQ